MTGPALLHFQVYFPILMGMLLLLFPRMSSRLAYALALFAVVLSIALWFPLFVAWKAQLGPSIALGFQLSVTLPELIQPLWAGAQNAASWPWSVGIDGLSLVLIGLTLWTDALVVLCSPRMVHEKLPSYLGSFLVLQGLMVGVFIAQHALLFYTFWELTLIPMFLLVGIFGSAERQKAALKFFLYTFLGSIFMLLALIKMGDAYGSMDFSMWRGPVPLPLKTQILLAIALVLGFGIKVPMWPVHTWLPDAHTEAPAGGSAVLAAIMLKMGGYGFFRLLLPLLPEACEVLAPMMVLFSLLAIVYVGWLTMAQTDVKRLVAYSSIAHMGIVTLGCFIIFLPGMQEPRMLHLALEGAMFQMIAHGLSSAALFLIIGMLYERLHTRDLKAFGGLVSRMPVLSAFFVLFAMSNVGLPGTAGFVGEWMVLLASMKAHAGVAFFASLTLILAAVYTLSMLKKVVWGKVVHDSVRALSDIDAVECVTLALLAVPVLVLGCYPELILPWLKASVCLSVF